MRLLNVIIAATLALPLAVLSGSAMAASAHNSQAGAYGDTKNAAAPTPASPRVKRHKKAMHKAM